MNSNELRHTLRDIVQMYFANATVLWSNGRYTKPNKPYITISLRSVTKTIHSIRSAPNGVLRQSYPSQAVFTVNLITEGKRKASKEGYTDIYDNTAVADLEDFCNFIESVKVSYICDEKDISIVQNGTVTDVTALLDGMEPEYRAMVEFTVDYMQEVSGGYNVSNRIKVHLANQDNDQDDGEDAEAFEPTPSGGRTEELVNSEIGYFEQVEKIESED